MAFNPTNLTLWSAPNAPGPAQFGYETTDTVATVSVSTYFNVFANSNNLGILAVSPNPGDLIQASCSDGVVQLRILTINPITTAVDNADILPGTITNAMIAANAAIAFSKLAALPSAQVLVGSAGNVATAVAVTGDIAITNGGVTSIAAGAIVNADVNASAAIAYSKLAALPSAEILVGSAGNVATAVAVTGDIAITNGGVTSIAAGAIVNADVNASAAIDYSKLAALPSAQILVGSAGNVATAVAMSGDVAIDNAGATTIQAGAIDLGMLSAGITPSHVVKFAGQPTTVGGAAAEAFTVNGVAATDLAFVQIVDDGTANVTVLQAVCTLNTLTVTFSANPGNDCIFNYQILRAAS